MIVVMLSFLFTHCHVELVEALHVSIIKLERTNKGETTVLMKISLRPSTGSSFDRLILRQAHPSTGSSFDKLILRQAHPSTSSSFDKLILRQAHPSTSSSFDKLILRQAQDDRESGMTILRQAHPSKPHYAGKDQNGLP